MESDDQTEIGVDGAGWQLGGEGGGEALVLLVKGVPLVRQPANRNKY